MEEEKLTTIQISTRTRARLMAYGKMGDTFESLLARLLDEMEACGWRDVVSGGKKT